MHRSPLAPPPAHAAVAWASAAATAASRVPARGAEAAAWVVRGWAEVAYGCAVLRVPEAYDALDEVVRWCDVEEAGTVAARLRSLRALGGPVPAFYPGTGAPGTGVTGTGVTGTGVTAAGPVPENTWADCARLGRFCDRLCEAIDRPRPGGPADVTLRATSSTTTEHLRWGEAYRPSAIRGDYLVVPTAVPPSLVWRTWMTLPTADRPRVVLAATSRMAHPSGNPRGRVAAGVHIGAHLDHLTALLAERLKNERPKTEHLKTEHLKTERPSGSTWHNEDAAGAALPAEFGRGLLTAEAYAMAVELLASVESLRQGDLVTVRQLRSSIVERIGRIPGYRSWHADAAHRAASFSGSSASPSLDEAAAVEVDEFAKLPRLATTYVTDALRLLATPTADPLLPAKLGEALRARWTAARADFPPAAELSER